MSEKKFPEGFYWGEKVRGTFARPCQQLCEYLEQSGDKAKIVWETILGGSQLRCSENLNRICKIYSVCKTQQLC